VDLVSAAPPSALQEIWLRTDTVCAYRPAHEDGRDEPAETEQAEGPEANVDFYISAGYPARPCFNIFGAWRTAGSLTSAFEESVGSRDTTG
jgi:hypothetical protein